MTRPVAIALAAVLGAASPALATLVHGPSARTQFESFRDRSGDTFVDFETIPNGPLRTNAAIPGVTFRTTFGRFGITGPIDFPVAVTPWSFVTNSPDNNRIVGARTDAPTTIPDGQNRYEIAFSAPQRRAGVQRIWHTASITRFYGGATLLAEHRNTVNSEFVGWIAEGDDTSRWVTRIELDGGLISGAYQVGDTDDLFYGTAPGCPVPGAPSLSGPSSLPSGRSLALTWTAASGLDEGGEYVLETSLDAFATVSATVRTARLSAVLPTAASENGATLSARVHAVQGCGTPGPTSSIAVQLLAATAVYAVSREPAAMTAELGGASPATTAAYRNVGAVAGRLSLRAEGSFFAVEPASLDVAPGAEAAVTLTAAASALASTGLLQGSLVATFDGGELRSSVSLTVVRSAEPTGARARAGVSSIVFVAPAGQTPGPQTVEIEVGPLPGDADVTLVPTVGPGGAWLVLPGDLGRPVPASGRLSLTLGVDRGRRAPGEIGLVFRTILRLTPAGGNPDEDSAVLEVLDVDQLSPGPGAGARAAGATPPGGSSFVLPAAVKAVSGISGATFTTDGWLRNLGGAAVEAQLFATADGRDGLVDPTVLVTGVTLQPGASLRLSDLMTTVFRTAQGSASVEVRSPAIASLSFRSSTDSVLGGDPRTRFGTEIPTAAFRTGARLGVGELIVPGIDEDESNRANLILAETAGASAIARVTLNGPDGALLGTSSYDVAPFSKRQVNRIVNDISAGTRLSGGWLGVEVASGQGAVVPVATVIDNASGSFSAVPGKGAPPPPAAARSAPLNATAARYLIPTVARTLGLNSTLFFTSLSLVNGTAAPAALNLTYHYVDQDDGGRRKSASRSATLPPRGALPKSLGNDVVRDLFGVTARSFGYIVVEGALTRVAGVARVSAQVDPDDPTKGFNSSQVNGIFLDAPSVMAREEEERRFAGLEKSFQRRSNLILVEVDGQPASVTVRLYSGSGDKLAEGSFAVGAGEYRQLTDVFASLGLGPGPFQNVEVTAQVAEGQGRVLAAASVIDNLSRSPQIFVLTPPGPPGDPSIGF